MASMNSKVKRAFDAEASVTLRNAADGAETASAAEAAVALSALNKAYWDNDELAYGKLHVNIHVEAADLADTDETYDLAVEVADDSGFTTNVVEICSISVPGPGYYMVPVDADTAKDLGNTPTHIRVNATLGGTSPSITYGCWID